MDIKVVYQSEKETHVIHKNISKWEIKDKILYLYRGEDVEVVYNMEKIIGFWNY
jgi:hypothetical protein